jgi:hypothetical protein
MTMRQTGNSYHMGPGFFSYRKSNLQQSTKIAKRFTGTLDFSQQNAHVSDTYITAI